MNPMNEIDLFASEWMTLCEPIRQHWKMLTAADLDQIDGHFNVLVNLLQVKYGYSKPLAEDDVVRFVRDHTAERVH